MPKIDPLPESTESISPEPGSRAALMLAAAAVLVATILPCVATFAPTVYLDVDPRLASSTPDIRLGPTGFAALHTASVLIATMAIAVSRWAGGRLRWWTIGFGVAGMAASGWQMTRDPGNVLLGGGWIAAAALGIGAAHLARHEDARRVLIAGLLALAAPLAGEAVWFTAVELPATVEQFERGRDQFAQSQGWEPGSAAYELYERRIRSPDAVGAFGLANLLGSVAATLLVLGLGIGMGLTRQRFRVLLPIATALGAGVALWLSHSRGAMLAAPLGIGLLLLGWLGTRWGIARRALGIAALTGVGAVVLAVLVVGGFGAPDGSVLEVGGLTNARLSLLFRYQYWAAALRIVMEAPIHNLALGVGPEGFKQAYLWAKNPLNPEEISSAHNVFVDYGTMLGFGGLAWCGLLLSWLWRGAQGVGRLGVSGESAVKPDRPGIDRATLGLMAGVGLVVFGMRWVVEAPSMYADNALVFLGELVAFVFIAGALASAGWMRRSAGALSIIAAAATLLAHNQVSMVFFFPSSVAAGWVVLGIAGGVGAREPRWDGDGVAHGKRRMIEAGVVAVLGFVVAGAIAIGYTRPIAAQQQRLAAAESALVASAPAAARSELASVEPAWPGSEAALRWRVRLLINEAAAVASHGHWGVATERLDRAITAVNAAADRRPDRAWLRRLRADINTAAANILNDRTRWPRVIDDLEQAVALAPYDLQAQRRLFELHRQMGQSERTAEVGRRLLELDRFNRLDPAKQLNDRQRREVEAFLRGAGNDRNL